MSAYLWDAAWVAWLSLKYIFLLWVYFLAVMKLRDIRDAGKLVGPIKYPAYLVLGIGYALDAAVNIFPTSLILLERPRLRPLPPLKREWTVSERTKRWAATDTWRGVISRWLRSNFLAKADHKGGHD